MRFVRAECDNITFLAEHKGNPEPNFLFYLDGQKVANIEGADIPEIMQKIETYAPSPG